MSLVTRCPICGTMFKIVPDQLRVSEGWVRCGNCTQVFDASAHLQDLDPPAIEASDPRLPNDAAQTPSVASGRDDARVRAPGAPSMEARPGASDLVGSFVRTAPSVPIQSNGQPTGRTAAPVPASPAEVKDGSVAGAAQERDRKVPPPIFSDRPRTRPSEPPLSPPVGAPAVGAAASPVAPEPSRGAPLAAALGADHLDLAAPSAGEKLESPAPWRPIEPTFDLKLPPPGRFESVQGQQEEVVAAPDFTPTTTAPATASVARDDGMPRHRPDLPHGIDAIADPQASHDIRPVAALEPEALPDEPQVRTVAPEGVEQPSSEVRESTLQAMEFMRDARRRAFWAQPTVRSLGWIGCLLLLIALGVQVLVLERDRIAATYPDLRDGLESVCASLGCQVQPYRRIESLAIESSAFDRLRTDEFQFSLAVRNRSALTLAMPYLELTLTDGRDRVLARRVFSAADIGAAPTIGPRVEWSAALPVVLAPAAAPSQVAGYRLVAFYP